MFKGVVKPLRSTKVVLELLRKSVFYKSKYLRIMVCWGGQFPSKGVEEVTCEKASKTWKQSSGEKIIFTIYIRHLEHFQVLCHSVMDPEICVCFFLKKWLLFDFKH